MCPTAVPPEDPRSLLLDRRTARARDAGRVPPRPVLEPGQPGRARAHDRPRDLATRPTAASRTSSPASAPAARSPASAARLKAQNPDVQIIGADPSGSVYSGGTGRPYLVEGVGEDFWPTTFDPSLVDRVVEVSDAESFLTARRVTQRGGPAHRRLVRHRGARRARGRARRSAPTTVVVVLLPDSGRSYLSKIFDDEWMFDMGFLRADGPVAGDVLAAKDGDLPDLVLDHARRAGARRDRASCATTGVSQLVVSVTKELPLAAKEVVGTLRELALMDQVVPRRRRARPPGRRRSWSAAMPMIGDRRAGRATSSSRLEQQPSVLVLDGGHPIGVLDPLRRARVPRRTRAAMTRDRDRAQRATAFETRAIHAGQDPDAGHRRGRPADHASRRRSRRTRSASTAATSTRAAATRPAPRSRRASRRSKARATGSRSRAGSPPRTRCCARSLPATT